MSAEQERAAGAAREQVEVVALDGTVERVVDRAEMRAGRLRHRCTYVALVDGRDRLVVHQRATWKDVWPGRWDVAFGGVADVDEPWDAAARRELAEEAGVHAPVEEVARGTYDDERVSVLGRVYVAHHEGPVTCPDGEVVAVDRVPVAGLEAWLAERPTCPDSVALVVPALLARLRRTEPR